MHPNKVEYSTSKGMYCMIHDVNIPFFIPEYSSSKVIQHRFRVDIGIGESGIGYETIIGRDLIVKLGLSADFKCQFLQWDSVNVPKKEPIGLLGKPYLTIL